MQLCQYMNSCKHSLFNCLSSANMIIFSNLGKWCLVWPNANNEEMSISRRIDGGKLVPVCLSFVHYRSMGALLGDTGYIFGKWEYILGDRRTWQSVFHMCACFNYFGPKLPKHHKHGNIRSTTSTVSGICSESIVNKGSWPTPTYKYIFSYICIYDSLYTSQRCPKLYGNLAADGR